jgi:hypothetical protein
VYAWSWERSRRGPAWREGLNVIYTIYTIYRSARSLQVNLSIMHAAHYCLIDEMKPKLGGRSNLNASNVVINMCLKALSLHQGSGRRPNTRSTTVAAKHEVDLRSEYYPFLRVLSLRLITHSSGSTLNFGILGGGGSILGPQSDIMGGRMLALCVRYFIWTSII